MNNIIKVVPHRGAEVGCKLANQVAKFSTEFSQKNILLTNHFWVFTRWLCPTMLGKTFIKRFIWHANTYFLQYCSIIVLHYKVASSLLVIQVRVFFLLFLTYNSIHFLRCKAFVWSPFSYSEIRSLQVLISNPQLLAYTLVSVHKRTVTSRQQNVSTED